MRKPIFCESLEGRLFLTTTPNDASYASEWGLSAVAASTAWDTTTGSAAAVVADIDTGLDYTHDDLYLNVWINPDEIPTAIKKTLKDTDGDGRITFYDLNASANRGKVADVDKNGRVDAADILTRSKYGGWADGADEGSNGYVDDLVGWDFANNDRNPLDYDGHGTHTAGTIGATGNNGTGVSGVDWQVSLMAVKIFDDQGNSASDRAIAAAIRYSADNGARVSNNSWGGSGYSTRIYNAIAYAADKGQLFVVAAGNDSANLDSRFYNDYPSEYALDNIITVGATASSGSMASYSNYGASAVDVFAPGSNVLSTYLNNDYETMSGTSMAAPHVTGAAALMLAANAKLTAAQLKARLIAGADQNASLAARSVAGGELNVANALADTTGTRYTGSTSSDPLAGLFPGRRRRFFFSLSPEVPSSPSTPSTPTTPPSAGTGSGSSSSSSSATSTPTTATTPVPAVPSAATTQTPANAAAGRQLLATPVTPSSEPSTVVGSQSSSSATATAGRAFSDRRVSATSAGYEPAMTIPIASSIASRDPAQRPAAPAVQAQQQGGAQLASALQPRVPVDQLLATAPPSSTSELTAGAYVPVPDAGLLPLLSARGADGETPTPLASATAMTGLARVWASMGTPGRAAALVTAVAGAVAGGYAQLRRKVRARAATSAAGESTTAAEPLEFPLRHEE